LAGSVGCPAAGNSWWPAGNAVYIDSTFMFIATNFVLSPGAEIEVFATSVNANQLNINLTGNEFGQQITGNDRNNILDGGGGADTLVGGSGNDVYIVDVAGDVVTENAGQGTDEIRTALANYSIAAIANVENLTGTSASGQSLTGNAGDNVIRGAGGNDTLIGGGGNDSYYVNNSGDSVVEAAGQGIDRVYASADFILGAGQSVEIISTDNDAGTAAVALRGNELGNLIYGNAGVNALAGGGGDDRVDGGAGNDRIEGGLGGDRLTGGSGADMFVYGAVQESQFALRSDGEKVMPDTIVDFASGQDRIDLSGIDANAGTAGDDAFTYLGTAAFTGHAGELRFELHGAQVLILADIDGNGVADMQILAMTSSLQAGDFVL